MKNTMLILLGLWIGSYPERRRKKMTKIVPYVLVVGSK